MKKILILVLIINFILASSAVLSVGISPSKVLLTYIPGEDYEVTFLVKNTAPYFLPIEISIISRDGNDATAEDQLLINKHITIKPSSFLLAPGFAQKVVFKIENFPELKVPGLRTIYLSALENKAGGRTEVRAKIEWRVPYPGYYFDFRLNEPRINIGETANFEITGISRGYETVKRMRAKIRLFNKNEQIAEFFTNEIRNTATNQEFILNATWDSAGYTEGTYNWTATLMYDNQQTSKPGIFRIGTLRVDVVNFTKEVEINKLNKFDVTLEGYWNEPIQNVFAEIKVYDKNNLELLQQFKTDFIPVLNPWTIDKVSGYMDTKNNKFDIGLYFANVTVHYKGEQSSLAGYINVVPEKRMPLILRRSDILLMIMVVIILGNMFVFFVLMKKGKKQEKEEQKKNTKNSVSEKVKIEEYY